MPAAPLPPDLEAFLAAPRPAVVATVRPDGSPSSAATWYDWRDQRVVLSMDGNGARARNLRHDPRFSLTVLADDWYHQLTVLGRIVELRSDTDFADLDRISHRYTGEAYPRDGADPTVTAFGVVERWHTWGTPGR